MDDIEMTEEEKSALGISKRTYKYTLNCIYDVRDAKTDLKSLSELQNNSNGLTWHIPCTHTHSKHYTISITMQAITNATFIRISSWKFYWK